MAFIPNYEYTHKDRYGRLLSVDDKCLRVTIKKNCWKPKIEIVTVMELTNYKIKIGERRYVDSENLILLSPKGL